MKKIYGMIHMAGTDAVDRAMDEIKIYEEEGLTGFILENYHGTVQDIIKVLNRLKESPSTIQVGLNILPNEYRLALNIASLYKLDFIQLDHIAGRYISAHNVVTLDIKDFTKAIIEEKADVRILGGVWPKYYHPTVDSDLKSDIKKGLVRCHEIVVTGEMTGKETPLDKIKEFRRLMTQCELEILENMYNADGSRVETLAYKELIVGAGVTPLNVGEQLAIADGAIVGSAFKPNGRTHQMVDKDLVRTFMDEVRKIK